MWFIYALLAALTASLVAILGKLGLKNVDSTLATTLRSLIMAVFLVFTSFFLGKLKPINFQAFSSKDLLLLIFSGVAGALSWLFYFLALKVGLASRVGAIDRTSLVFIVFLSALFLGESLTVKSVAGAVLMIVGAILISLK